MNLFSVTQIFIQLITIATHLLKYYGVFHKIRPVLPHAPFMPNARRVT